MSVAGQAGTRLDVFIDGQLENSRTREKARARDLGSVPWDSS